MKEKIDALLMRLVNVRGRNNGKWTACCPAHEDKTPSLSIRELDDGRVLIHCFAGCSPLNVVTAVGLTFADLYTTQNSYSRIKGISAKHRRELADGVLTAKLIIACYQADCAAGLSISTMDVKSVALAIRCLKKLQGVRI